MVEVQAGDQFSLNVRIRSRSAAHSHISRRFAPASLLKHRITAEVETLARLRRERERLQGELPSEEDAANALAAFDPVWATLSLREQSRLLQLLIERIDYDGRDGTISITSHPSGIKALADRTIDGDAA